MILSFVINLFCSASRRNIALSSNLRRQFVAFRDNSLSASSSNRSRQAKHQEISLVSNFKTVSLSRNEYLSSIFVIIAATEAFATSISEETAIVFIGIDFPRKCEIILFARSNISNHLNKV